MKRFIELFKELSCALLETQVGIFYFIWLATVDPNISYTALTTIQTLFAIGLGLNVYKVIMNAGRQYEC